ncbi:hypothetical protein AXG93_1130s1030 [Marchantia polymorpha subsp. ruderalis]|uniref:Uncharacterized protein n=1 Tax=Marchantia polymorpha subsp. ruderalis TaxID=1480154 RepID=A0A176VG59_MARPO|nr:hypothetical protein AXG93_1130s1030 [Marchantia polymorpha subsp. ruderalis]
MAMTCRRSCARSLPTLVRSAGRCSIFDSLPNSSTSSSSIPAADSPSNSWNQRESWSKALLPSDSVEGGDALGTAAGLGRLVDEDTTHPKSRPSQAFLSNTVTIGRSLGCHFWNTQSPGRNEGQTKQLKRIYTSSSGYHAAPPPCPDLSLEVDLIGFQDQGKLDPFALVADELTLLGQRLRDMVTAEVPKLAEAAEYFFKHGVEGKRFRPMVLLLMASSMTALSPDKALSYSEQKLYDDFADERRRKQQRIAEITEMIHVASLLHDDVLDHADTRRGIGSLNSIMGNKLAVLAGDFLLARASVALASLKNTDVVDLLSRVLEHLVTGAIMQLTTNAEELCSMEYYMQKTFYKTASLMANSCKSIAILAEQSRDVAELAFEYGRHLGIAYQLVDDALDFIGTKSSLGKPALNDIAQGIATAPILFALEEHPELYNLINRKFRKAGDIDAALEMVMSSQGIARTKQLAAYHAQQAALAIAGLPPSSSRRGQLCRRALTELTQTVINRSK